MSAPDPDFVKWFGGEFQRRLEATAVPGMADASWDRKAAWLLWTAERHTASRIPADYTAPRIEPSSNSVFD